MGVEQWRDVPGYEGLYQVSSFGRVKSSERDVYKVMYGGGTHSYKRKGRIMKPDYTCHGYFQVQLSLKGSRVRYRVHRLVALAFIPNVFNKPCINHIDCDRTNNTVENLEWCTSSENAIHTFKMGRWKNNYPVKRGSDINTSKLKEDDVKQILSSPLSSYKLAKIYGVTKAAIRFIKIRRNWSHVNP